jgi:TPR repeat protein/DNA-binding XRE family transcriptional regulator
MIVSFADYAFPIHSDDETDVQYLYDNLETLDYRNLTILAQCFASGDVSEIGLEADFKKSEELAKKAWELSHKQYSEPLVLLGVLEAGIKSNYLKAFGYFNQAVAMGNAMASTNLGALHLHNTIPNSSADEAARLFEKAYDLDPNNPVVCYNLGIVYFKGVGVQKNKEKATLLFEKASSTGHLRSKEHLAFIYSDRFSEEKKDTKATLLFKELSDAGNAYGMAGLGSAFLTGKGTIRNVYAGLELLQKASKLGDANAHFELFLVYSGRYRLKEYVSYNLAQSLKFLSLAVKGGHPRASWEYKQIRGTIDSIFEENDKDGRPTALITLHEEDTTDEPLFAAAEAKSVGEMFERAREGVGLSKVAASKVTGIARPSILSFEKGEHSPSLDRIKTVAEAYGFDVRIELTPKDKS